MKVQRQAQIKKSQKLLLVVALIAVLAMANGCQKHVVKGDVYSPYTPTQVKKMMEYHGALVAKFDGRQWWFLAGRRWIRIENAGAYRYVMLSDAKNHSSKQDSSLE